LPWNDFDNQRILPSKNYMYYTSEMRKLSDDIQAEVMKLNLDDIKSKAVLALGSLYNEADYPEDNQDLKNRYSVNISVAPIPNSADFRITQITDQDIEAIQKQIEERVTSAHKSAMKDLWNRLYGVVETAYETFKDTEAGFHTSKLDNISAVVEVLRRLNMDDDQKLERLCKLAEERLCSFDAKEIKNDKAIRKEAENTSKKLLDLMSEYI